MDEDEHNVGLRVVRGELVIAYLAGSRPQGSRINALMNVIRPMVSRFEARTSSPATPRHMNMCSSLLVCLETVAQFLAVTRLYI